MNKKGFTLVELLAVIVILVLIVSISIVFYNSYKKSSTNMLTKSEIAMLMDAGANYYKEFSKDKNYIYYKDTRGNIVSCVRIQSLIDTGYYKNNVKFLKEGLSYDKTVVKITENYQGVINYELIEDYTKNISVCTDYNYTSDISKQNISTSNNGNNDVAVSGNIEKDNNRKNTYNLTLNIDADVYRENIIQNKIYVSVVLDRSYSMADNNAYAKATSAVKMLAKNIVSKIDNSQISLIAFCYSAEILRNFEHNNLNETDFGQVCSDTNIPAGLNKSMRVISSVQEDNALKYVILLTDAAMPAASGFNDKFKDLNTTFIIIGYNLNESPKIYGKLASVDNVLCVDSDYFADNNHYCYYHTNTNGVAKLFDNIANSIVKSYKTLNGAEIHIKFNDVIRVQNGSLYDTIKFKDDFNNDIQKKYKIFIDEEKLNQKYGCGSSTCDVIPLFDENNSYVKLIGTNNEDKGRIKLTSPMISIKKNEVVYVN